MTQDGLNIQKIIGKQKGWKVKQYILSLSIIKIKKNMNRQELVNALKELNGETLEHIIRVIGMEDQMLRHLIMKAPMFQVMDLVREKDWLDIVELERATDDYLDIVE